MIAPGARLLWWVATLVVPLATIAGAARHLLPICLVPVGTLFAVALFDGMRARRRLSGLAVDLPPLVRLTRDREKPIDITVRHEPGEVRRIRVALPMPRGFDTPIEHRDVELPAAAEAVTIAWPCTPRQRGNYSVSACHLEGSSALKFWTVRRSVPVSTEIRVYPNLLGERKTIAALYLRRGSAGIHAQRQVGKGREFEKLREYIAGDGYDEIHWKATAKRGRPVTKVFQIERTQEVYVAIDSGRLAASMGSSGREAPIERFVSSSLILARSVQQQGDLFGLMAFADGIRRFVRAGSGRSHLDACLRALYTLQPRPVSPDFEEAIAFLRLRLRRRALLIFLTSLDDPVLAESFVRSIALLSRQHLVMVCMPRPSDTGPLFAGTEVRDQEDLYTHLAGHIAWRGLKELSGVLQRQGVGFGLIEDDEVSAALVSRYMNIKRRQIL